MFIVIREHTIAGELIYNIIGCFKEKEEAKKFVHKCIDADIIVSSYREENNYCIYDFRNMPRCYRYLIQEVEVNETICD